MRPRDPALLQSKFSGGNQQKLVLAREALPQPQVLLVGQPTRGVDIGAIEFIHGRLRAMRDAGGAVLVVSSELDEILALADRVLVMGAGRIAGELPIDDCSEAGAGPADGGAQSRRASGSVASARPPRAPVPGTPACRWPGQHEPAASNCRAGSTWSCCRPSTSRWRCWSAASSC